MPDLTPPKEARHAVAIIGGAVAGSEAAALCAERGLTAIVLEQNDRPYGKIEDGLPRWHDKLRAKEYAKIGENLQKPSVLFVPRTALGRDVTLTELLEDWGVSSVLLASGAWRDRPLPVEGADAYVDRGLVYQNPLVYWYNHYPDAGYDGPRYEVEDGAVVIGGGLASVDVVKLINFELYKRALAARDIRVTTLELEHAGIPETLKRHGLEPGALGVEGCTLYYRRSKQEMPLASPPPNATPKQLEKIGQVRAKVMDKVIDKYLVRFCPNHAPSSLIVEGGRLVGVRFQKTATVDGKLARLEEFVDVRSPLVVSSIGSIPQPLEGLPMRGELLDFASWDTGQVKGFDNVFGLGNALTGKGNIKDSRKNALVVTEQVLRDYLGVGDGATTVELDHDGAREAAEPALQATQDRPPLSRDALARVYAKVQAHWTRAGYDGDYEAWIARHAAQGEE